MQARTSRSYALVALTALAVALPLELAPTAAYAAPPVAGARGKKVRISADTELFGWANVNPFEDPGDPKVNNTNIVGFGLNRYPLPDSFDPLTNVGISRPIVNLGVGYVFAGDRAIVGAKFGFTVDGVPDNDDDDQVETSTVGAGGLLAPYFRWVFLPGKFARPYVDARFGMAGTSGKQKQVFDMGPIREQRNTADVLGPVVGIGGGVHLFPTEYFSVDLGLQYELRVPHARSSQVIEDDMGNSVETSADWRQVAVINGLGVLLGVSVWL